MQNKDTMQAIVDRWNENCPESTSVIVTKDHGEPFETVTRSEAWLLGNNTPVVMVKGISGGYLLSRVQVKSRES